jgi:type VI protein secretion system component VasK
MAGDDTLFWPVLAGIAVVLVALVLLVMAWRLGRAAGREGSSPLGVSALVASMRAPEWRALAASFASAMGRLRTVSRGPGWRYAVPWVLLLGGGRSGRSTLATAINLHRPFTSPFDAHQAEYGCTWHMFEPGLLLEPAEAVLWGKNGHERNTAGWRRLMNLLLRYRRERGIDGVVITVSCAELLGPDPAALIERAGTLREHLRELQQYLGLRVPVYVLVTKCDLVTGFSVFWRPLVADYGHQMFGWSNDETPETSYGPHLIARAFDEIGRSLHRILLGQAVHGDGIADLAFLFPAEFQKLAEPLGRFVDRLFHVDVYQDPHFFRGIHFTGDAPAVGEPQKMVAAPLTARPGSTEVVIDQAAPHPLFVTDLFAEKVFRETRMIQPARREWVARGRASRLRWVGLVVVAFVLVGGLWSSYRTLQASAQKVIPLTHRIAFYETSEQVPIRLGGPVLEAYRTISQHSLTQPFMPASWLSALDSKVENALANGFELVVFKPVTRELTARMNALLARDPPVLSADNQSAAFDALDSMIAAFDKLARLAVLYNRGNRLNADELTWLVQTLIHVNIGEVLHEDLKLYADVMARVTVERFDMETRVAPANATLDRMVRAASQTIESDGLLVRQVQDLSLAVLHTAEARFAPPLAAAGQLKTLALKLQQIKQTLEASNLAWRFVLHPEQDSYWTRQLDSVRRNPLLGEAAANAMQTLLTGKVSALRAALLAVTVPEVGPLLVADSQADGRLQLAPTLEALSQALPPLLAYDFLSNPARQPAEPFPRTNLVMWAPEPLERALAYENSFKEMEAGPLAHVPETLRPMIMAVATQSLQGAMLSAVADAEVLERRGDDFRQFGEEDALLREAKQFGRAAVPLGKVLEALQKRGFDQAYSTVSGIIGQHALAMLEQIDGLVEASGVWLPVDQFRSWDGTLPMNFEGYQVLSDGELDQYLKTSAARIDWLATEVAQPVVGALQGDAVPAPLRRNSRVVRWLRIIEDLGRYKASNPASSLAGLERFIRVDLAAVKPGVCPDSSDAAATAAGVDFFSQRLQIVRRYALTQCHRIAGDAIKVDFTRLATDFNSTLAGRYPFADGTAADTPEASPDAVGAFLERFSPDFEAAVRRGLGTPIPGSQEAAALQFLDRLAQVRSFMAPLIPAAATPPSAFEVEAEFRVNRDRETGGNQIIEWSLGLGDQQVSRGDDAKTARWRPGEPVTIKLRWAKDAPVAPIAALGAAGKNGTINADRALVVSYAGQWGLIRLLQNNRAPSVDLPGLIDRQPQTLKFSASTGNVPVTDAPEPNQSQLTGQTNVFVRVSALAASADGKTKRALPLPIFPFTAPRLDQSVR